MLAGWGGIGPLLSVGVVVVACPGDLCVFLKDCVLDLMMIHFHKAVKSQVKWLVD